MFGSFYSHSININRSNGTRSTLGAKSLDILNNLDSSNSVVGRKALNSILLLPFSSPSFFKFSHHPNIFINLHLSSINRSDLPLLKRRSFNFKQFYLIG